MTKSQLELQSIADAIDVETLTDSEVVADNLATIKFQLRIASVGDTLDDLAIDVIDSGFTVNRHVIDDLAGPFSIQVEPESTHDYSQSVNVTIHAVSGAIPVQLNTTLDVPVRVRGKSVATVAKDAAGWIVAIAGALTALIKFGKFLLPRVRRIFKDRRAPVPSAEELPLD